MHLKNNRIGRVGRLSLSLYKQLLPLSRNMSFVYGCYEIMGMHNISPEQAWGYEIFYKIDILNTRTNIIRNYNLKINE